MKESVGSALGRAASLMLCVSLLFGQLGLVPTRAMAAEPVSPPASSPQAEDTSTPSSQPATPPAPTVVREVIEKRTATSKHYLMSDSSYRAVISQAPVHYKDPNGKWADIDTRLVPDAANEGYVTKAAPIKTHVADQAQGKPVRIEGDGYSVGIDMLGVAEGAKLVYGNKARYMGVADDTSLEYESLDDGVKETLVLGSADAPSKFSFSMSLEGLEIRQVRPGEWALFRPGADKPELEVGGLCVFDSSLNAAGDPAYCPETTMSVTPSPGGATVSYEVSEKWLADPARQFPVMIDPSLTKTPSADTFVSSAYTTTNYGASTELKVGYYDSTTGHNRSLVKFDLSSIASNAYVDAATYSAWQFHTYYTNTPKVTYLGKVSKSWGESSTWSSLGCSVNNEAGLCAGISNQSPSGRDIWVNWGVTSVVQDWVEDPTKNPNYGFMMYQNEGDSSQMPECWRKFYSSEYSDAAKRPKLVVNYSYPRHEVSQYASSYTVGDTVYVQVLVRSANWE